MPGIADLIANGCTIKWKCQQCGRMANADVEAMRLAKGDDYDLTDKTAPCRSPGCGYWVTFYAQDHMVMRSLLTEEFNALLSQRRTAWLRDNVWNAKSPSAGEG